MALPGSAAPPAVDRRRDDVGPPDPARPSSSCCAEESPRGTSSLQEAFENAIAMTMALGGSTNAVLHLLAIAREAEVDL